MNPMMFRFSFRRFCGRFRNAAGVAPLPNASALLEVSGNHFIWKVPSCPLCQRQHIHGGGLVVRDDPRSLLGHRNAHCIGVKGGGYILVDSDPARTGRLVEDV